MARMLMTVRGAVAAESHSGSVSWVLPHEHLIHRISKRLTHAQSPPIAGATDASKIGDEIQMDQLHELRMNPSAYGGRNLIMEREDEVFREVEALTTFQPGVGVVVDVTTVSEGRDLAKLRRLAERLQCHVVASTSYDEHAIKTLPGDLIIEAKAERVAKTLETELMFGVEGTDPNVNAGVIYQQIHLDSSRDVLLDEVLARGLAMVQANTTVPVYLSFSSAESTQQASSQRILDWIDALIKANATPQRIVICHADHWCDNIAFLVELGRRGVMLSFDAIGLYTVSDVSLTSPSLDRDSSEPPRDSTIARAIASLINNHGLTQQLLVSTNVTLRTQFQRYGGGGYAYLFRHFKGRLAEDFGVTEAHWTQIVRDNALGLLTWYTPPEAAAIPKHFLLCSICKKPFEPIVGEYFTKFQFIYCGTKCLRKHSKLGFQPLE
ncbi:hypothetical protein Poli38472_014035 [Pythium oligandrum]|uniref:Vms1-associating treble clef domain-containing protein n=1 Tax=Pythium oligandrum TaxID=41045 RepID=A0A8K1CPN4_PYTOL|nr:hypothetical protein Poli38472_014035 [Pythium oligandrum]|eukprot:TMW66723.1 hypothetical protein Poli38472_014035 [Pythium oligandrum]